MDDFAKIRYIYLYACKNFSYDIRFLFAEPSLKKEIYDKNIDEDVRLDNVELGSKELEFVNETISLGKTKIR